MKMIEQVELALGKEEPMAGDVFDLYKVRQLLFEMAKHVDELDERVFSREVEWDANKET